jgi:DNA-binding MarR family transcriptional regulator
MRADRLDATVRDLESRTALWREFLRAHQVLIQHMAEEMSRDHALPLEWFDVLIHLAEAPNLRLRQAALRDRLLLSESGVSRRLARMGKEGLIARTPAVDDRRGVEIALTERGQEALLMATGPHVDVVQSLFTDRLSADDEMALRQILGKLLKAEDGGARISDRDHE